MTHRSSAPVTLEARQHDLLLADLDHVVREASEAWKELRGCSVFVTGGTGFFGRWLLESFAHANALLRLEAKLVVLTRNREAFQMRAPRLAADPAISFVEGDVRTFTAATVTDQLESRAHRFSFVIHAATEASAKLNAEDPLRMIDTIVEGTRSTLAFAQAVAARRFLFTSSGAVYGAQPPDITHVSEEYLGAPDCTRPESAYGEGKRLAEIMCTCAYKQHEIEPVIARCFAFVGPFLPLDTHFAVGNFIRDAVGGGPIRVGGDGSPSRSYLYAADLAIWLWTLLAKGVACRPYNVGSSQAVTIAELADAVRMAVNPRLAVEIAQRPVPGSTPTRYVPNTTRARRELGLAEHIDLATAIQRTARFAAL